MAHQLQIVIACADPDRMTEFWAAALDYVPQPPPEGFETWEQFADAVGIPGERRGDIGAVIDPDGSGPRILFERWDGGAPSQRLHLDINSVHGSDATLESERARLEALGATFKREASGMAGESWIEMYDPEGNWFCVQ